MSIYNLAGKYYKAWMRLFLRDRDFPLFDINFKNHWLSPVLTQKLSWLFILTGEVFIQIFHTLTPLLLETVINTKEIVNFVYLIGFFVLLDVYAFMAVKRYCFIQIQLLQSLMDQAYKFFLTVDPSDHFTRVSGRLFAKIHRSIDAYEDFTDILSYDFLPIIISATTVMVSFFFIDGKLGFMAMIMIVFLAFLNVGSIMFNEIAFEPHVIAAEDKSKSSIMESLTQIFLVRSTFSSNEWNKEVEEKNKNVALQKEVLWISFITITFLSRVSHLLSMGIVGYYAFNMVLSGDISSLKATAIILTYTKGSYEVTKIGRKTYKLTRAVIQIKDLFFFIRGFGKQTFPVLASDKSEKFLPAKSDNITIMAEDLHFQYTEKAQIFECHNLKLSVPISQDNKLYGIIGPSGMGKTTFISILGGQLPPDSASVLINDIPIYKVDDNARRELIAIQAQTASSLSGTVRSNLLLGAQEAKEIYTDDKLIELLDKVGLWKIFKEKEGLESSIGEGGFTLSVGQRQRLNFASLYLRTKYFRPSLVLIDEPTSSLDEISERAITEMINEVASTSITMVIAHRINTLNSAVGLLDFSLIDKEKNLTFYSREDLLVKSDYYNNLLTGKAELVD